MSILLIGLVSSYLYAKCDFLDLELYIIRHLLGTILLDSVNTELVPLEILRSRISIIPPINFSYDKGCVVASIYESILVSNY